MEVNRILSIWRPGMYHGSPRMRNYFEGWYFKLVDQSEETIYAVIPGVSFSNGGEPNHSFIQVLNGQTAESQYHRFTVEDFRYSKMAFDISVGRNHFNADGISLDLQEDQNRIQGSLSFGDLIPWPVSLLSPGAMGVFQFIPRMECYHGILGFDHRIDGTLNIGKSEIDFTGGRGYIEKDWGAGFPEAWIWMQSNHFEETGVSFTSSIAKIPWLGSSFAGFLIGLLYDGTVYTFATYTGAQVTNLRVSENEVRFWVSDTTHGIMVRAARAQGGELRSPVLGEMSGRIIESLTAHIDIRFYRFEGNEARLLFSGTGRNAGLEVVGDTNELIM
jgi:hypothetical protein